MLSFVDYRRFGKWEINGEWGKDRGPDPISNYEVLFIKYKKVLYKFLIGIILHYFHIYFYQTKDFRSNILNNLEDVAFNGPICETMLNQKYFNGIGNYLR